MRVHGSPPATEDRLRGLIGALRRFDHPVTDLKRMGATTIEETLESVPGLHVSTVDAINSVTQIRGINSRVLVMVNNIPLVQRLLNAYRIKNAFL